MSTDTLRRSSWIVSAASLVLWAVTTVFLAYRVFVVGLSADQRRAVDQFGQQPIAALAEPLLATFAATMALGVLAVASLAWYGYAAWLAARRRRRRLEAPIETRQD